MPPCVGLGLGLGPAVSRARPVIRVGVKDRLTGTAQTTEHRAGLVTRVIKFGGRVGVYVAFAAGTIMCKIRVRRMMHMKVLLG